MGITALPANTIRQIGSTQCLTDPASVVKELIENSLDADATTIFVEVSSNTTGKIKVRDNGHGIAPEDRSMVCKRHHTSKIMSLEDLQDLGGQSLGFRGEALASAAEMSTRIVLTTRVESEPTAMEIGYDHAGLIRSEKPTSHAVGTTVEVDHFLSNFPVRKQSAEKKSAKCLLKIRKLLQAYALARPCVRLSFKVLRAKNEKGDWSYAPKSGAKDSAAFKCSILDAAINIFGRKAAEQLQPHSFTWSSTGELIKPAESGFSCPEASMKDKYSIDFLLVRMSITDTACINNLGQHITIDNRPVSCHRGVLKDISHHYKSCLKSAVGGNESGKIVGPLLIMNISCPTGSYDINVEPAKDDVLFTDAKTVLQVSQKSFDSIYGELKDPLEKRSKPQTACEMSSFDVLLAKRTTERASSAAGHISRLAESTSLTTDTHIEFSQSPRGNNIISQTEQLSHSLDDARSSDDIVGLLDDQDDAISLARSESIWRAPSFAGDQQDLESHTTCLTSSPLGMKSTSEQDDLRDINISNPWTLAKIYAPLRPPVRRDENHKGDATSGHLPTPQWYRGDVTSELTISSDNALTPPNASPVSFPYPIKAYSKRRPDDIATETSESSSTHDGFDALSSWLYRSRSSNLVDSMVQGDNEIFKGSDEPPLELTAAGNLPIQGTALRDIPDVSQRTRQKSASRIKRPSANDKPYINHNTNPECVWFESGEHSHPHRSQKGPTKNKPRNNSINLRSEDGDLEIPASIRHPDLAITLDYETRKAKATQDHREHIRREKSAAMARQHAETAKQRTLDSLLGPHATQPNLNSPHRNRQRKAVALLHTNAQMPTDESEKTMFPHAGTGEPPSKRLSGALPLERVKEQDSVLGLVLPLSTTRAAITGQMQKAANWDDYVYSGECTNALDEPDVGLLRAWERRVRQLVRKQYRKGDSHVEDGVMLDEEDVVFDPGQVFSASRFENV